MRLAVALRLRVGIVPFRIIGVLGAGGLLGVMGRIVSARALTAWLSWPTDVTSEAIVTAFGRAVLVGIICGIYPARKAARLDPIDALRFE